MEFQKGFSEWTKDQNKGKKGVNTSVIVVIELLEQLKKTSHELSKLSPVLKINKKKNSNFESPMMQQTWINGEEGKKRNE